MINGGGFGGTVAEWEFGVGGGCAGGGATVVKGIGGRCRTAASGSAAGLFMPAAIAVVPFAKT